MILLTRNVTQPLSDPAFLESLEFEDPFAGVDLESDPFAYVHLYASGKT